MKTPYFHRDRGYMLFAATLVMSLGVVGLSMSMMRTSHRMLDNVRSASVTNEISTKDLALRRQVGDDLMQQIVNAVNGGRTSATLGDVSGRYSTGSVGGQSRDAVSLNLTDSGAATGRSVTTGNSVALTVSSWSPTGGLYSAIALPVGPYRVKGGTVIGREFRVDYTRNLTVGDNVGNTTRTLTKTSSARIIEFPSQTALWGRSLRVRQGTVGGSIIGQNVTLETGATVTGSLTVSRSLNVASGAQVRSARMPVINTSASAALAKDLEIGENAVDSDTISVIRGNETATLVELGDRTPDAEGIPRILLRAGTPTNWDAYSLPYYQCSTRIVARLALGGATATYTISQSQTSSLSGRINSTSLRTGTLTQGGAQRDGLQLGQQSGVSVLAINMVALTALAGNNARAIYVDFADSNGRRLSGSGLAVTLSNAADLTALQGFSLVTPNRLVLTGEVNNTNPVPMSLMSYATRYGFSAPSTVQVNGQIGHLGSADSARNDVLSVQSVAGGVPDNRRTFGLSDIGGSSQLPPVNVLNWLVLTYEN